MNKKYESEALAQKVLAVAVKNIDDDGKMFDWAVYIDAVPGINHQDEFMQVARLGCKQHKRIAALLFPNIDIERYRK